MQVDNEKVLQIALGKIVRKYRKENTDQSLNNFAHSFDIGKGHMSMIENGKVCCSIVTAWKIAQGFNMKLSELIQILEQELGDDFTLIDE